MEINLSMLFSDNSDEEFIGLVTVSEDQKLQRIFLAEFRSRGYRRCFTQNFPASLCRRVRLFNPEKREMTTPQEINYQRIRHQGPHYQIMYFKTTWKSQKMGVEIEGEFDPTTYAVGRLLNLPPRHTHHLFSPHREIEREITLQEKTTDDKVPSEGKSQESTGKSSTSDYGTKCSSELTGGDAASSSGLQTMKSGSAVTGQDLVKTVERSVELQLKVLGEREHPGKDTVDIGAWLESLQIPDLPTMEDLDRGLGNIAEMTIGPEGGLMSLHSYHIRIPPNAVKTKTKFKFRISLEFDSLEYPPDLIPISLPLYCSPGNVDFSENISISLQTWLCKADTSPNSAPVPIFVYTKRQGQEWECVESSELSSNGNIEFHCKHFCVKVAFIKKSDAERVGFRIEHVLFRDQYCAYTSCHFLAAKPFESAMLRHLERTSTIIHPPTHTTFAKPGDEIRVNLQCKEPANYEFESSDSCVLNVTEDFYIRNSRASFSFLLKPKPTPDVMIEFAYTVGDKTFLKRDQLMEKCGGVTGNVVVQPGGMATITQRGVTVAANPQDSTSRRQAGKGTEDSKETPAEEVWYDCV